MKKDYCKKLILTCIFIAAMLPSLSANSFANPKNVSVIVTEYFDIIYTQDSAYAAQLLAEKADSLYLKACGLLEADPYFRIPVVLSPDTDVLNGCFFYAPYNYIILYDTLPDSGSLAVFSENLLSVFYHEVVHAVSIQKKSNFWRFAGMVFGDILTPAPLFNLPLSFIEGVTVSFESKDGEGRLNDVYATHIIAQAKLENKFPDWKQAAYTRDIYPVGQLPYLFGGAFAAYIQQKYGMEKYAQYWEECGKIQLFKLVPGVFKSVYRKDIETVWKDFKNSVVLPTQAGTVPNSPNGALPETTAMLNIADYENSTLLASGKESLYASAAAGPNGIAWIDEALSGVYYLSNEDITGSNTAKPEKLFSCSYGQTGLSFSKDGRYLVSSYVYPYPEGRNTIQIYDMEKRSFTDEKIQGIRDAVVITLDDGTEYLAGVETKSQYASIVFYDRESLTEVMRREFPVNSIPFSLVNAGEGNLAYILKEKNDWYITLYDPLTKEEVRVYDPENPIVIKHLNPVYGTEATEFSFSYAHGFVDGTFPRMGHLTLNSTGSSLKDTVVTVKTQTRDISGGVYNPVLINGTVVFNAKYYDHDTLHRIPYSALCNSQNYVLLAESDFPEESVQDNKVSGFEEKNYNPLKYMTDGIFIPMMSLTMTAGIDPLEATIDDFGVLLGFNYITQDPAGVWMPTLGLTFDTKNLSAQTQLSVVNSATPVTFTGNFDTVFNFTGYFESKASVEASYTHPLGNSGNSLSAANYIEGNWVSDQGNFAHAYADSAQIVFSTIKKKGIGFYESQGFEAVTGAGLFFDPLVPDGDKLQYNYNIGAGYKFARLLPVDNTRTLTFNLPSLFQAHVFPSTILRPDTKTLWAAMADVTLFSMEIQKGIPFLCLYANRLTLSANYTAGQVIQGVNYKDPVSNFSNIGSLPFEDSVALLCNITLRPIFGMLLTQLALDFGGGVRYYIRQQKFKFVVTLFSAPLEI